MLVRGALTVLAVHVVDDTMVQPQPGTSAGDHLVAALVPLLLLGLAFWAYPRLRGTLRGGLALLMGVLAVALAGEAWYYTREVGPSGDDFTGLVVIPAALLLIAVGLVTLWRTRSRSGPLPWRIARRALLGVAAVLTLGLVVFPVGLGYVTTHVGRAVVPPDTLGVAHEDVSFTTSDGLRLEGWYVPSRNRAAVIAFPGRRGPQPKARMLARHGYGVLLFDRRGEGRSEGDPNTWGWGGYRDAQAAIAWLQRRPDVDPDRIGGIGLSVGGEMLLETAARTPGLAAVVSEGAGSRTSSEEMLRSPGGIEGVLGAVPRLLKTASIAVSSNTAPPESLKDLVPRIAPRPILLIAAPHSGHGEELNRNYVRAAGAPKALWEIPESRHVGGQSTRPREYERRVVGFFDEALAR
jgi:hypothetical protein